MMRTVALLLGWLIFASTALAQTNPEGNAHPTGDDSPALTVSDPFGPTRPFYADLGDGRELVRARVEFAKALDLSPLRDVAVFEGGRVKILDTLARETVRAITGRKAYLEYLPGEADKPEKYAFDPLFTLLDLAIDPAFYDERPLVAIDYRPLREAFVLRGLVHRVTDGSVQEEDVASGTTLRLAPLTESEAERYMRLLRVTPLMLRAGFNPLRDKYEASEAHRRAFDAADRSVGALMRVPDSFRLIAPEQREEPWRHISEAYGPSARVQQLALELGAAWRELDATRANRAIAELGAALPTINPEVYPTTRRALEATYNRLAPFTWGYWLYLAALVTLLIAMGTQRRWIIAAGLSVLSCAVLMHAAGFIMRCIIAERFAIQNQFESMTGVSLFAAVVAMVIMAWRRQWVFGAAASAVGFLILIVATETRIPGQSIGREAAILNTSVLLKYHVTTVLSSYGLIALGFILSLFYLATHYAARARAALASGKTGVHLESAAAKAEATRGTLRDLDRATMVVLQLAFWTLGVGILLGAWWADHSWGRWWAFDPKETWALITWIIYLIVIHVRMVSKRRDLVTAWLSVLGFVMMLWTYFGVNLLLSGLHAYA